MRLFLADLVSGVANPVIFPSWSNTAVVSATFLNSNFNAMKLKQITTSGPALNLSKTNNQTKRKK